jgi:hypothetical protein
MHCSRLVGAAISLTIALSSALQAGPLILASSVVPVCIGNVAYLTITLNVETATFFFANGGLYYHFDPPSPGTLGPFANPFNLQIPTFSPGTTHILWISTSAAPTGGSSSPNYSFIVPACSNGLTWHFISTNSPTGTIGVGCGNSCDAQHGDTSCTAALPLLCIKKSGVGFPLPCPASVNNTDKYHKWSGGVVGTTSPTVPPTTLVGADTLCRNEFGADWRVAEFHDGWGWNFQAYGGVGDSTKHFWIHINDQPGATCWH